MLLRPVELAGDVIENCQLGSRACLGLRRLLVRFGHVIVPVVVLIIETRYILVALYLGSAIAVGGHDRLPGLCLSHTVELQDLAYSGAFHGAEASAVVGVGSAIE